LPWIFTERLLRELMVPQLKKECHGFPLGVWARSLDGESAGKILAR